jgi:hypothetical protein
MPLAVGKHLNKEIEFNYPNSAFCFGNCCSLLLGQILYSRLLLIDALELLMFDAF